VFSTVGTVLGGIWANDSWGRFWGWDPKENGALMIVLWELAMLHARMGGYIRDLGFAVASTFGAIIVAFSWWGVNLLGVGLHSYGFTSGIMPILLGFYAIELVVCACGVLVWVLERYRTQAPAVAAAAEISPVRKKRLPAKAAE
jgi:cytochrome c biogenesis factor